MPDKRKAVFSRKQPQTQQYKESALFLPNPDNVQIPHTSYGHASWLLTSRPQAGLLAHGSSSIYSCGTAQDLHLFPFSPLSLCRERDTCRRYSLFHPLYYNRSRKKTPWITRDFSGSSPLFLCGLLRCFALSKVFPAQHFHDTIKSSCDHPVVLRSVRDHAVCAVLVSFLRIPEVPAALLSQCIKRAVTEQAVEPVGIFRLVAWEILAFPVLEERVMLSFPVCFFVFHFRSFCA